VALAKAEWEAANPEAHQLAVAAHQLAVAEATETKRVRDLHNSKVSATQSQPVQLNVRLILSRLSCRAVEGRASGDSARIHHGDGLRLILSRLSCRAEPADTPTLGARIDRC
jgi:hypothetical protein